MARIKLFEKEMKILSIKADEYNGNRTRILSVKVEDTEVKAEAKPKGKGIILIKGVVFRVINEDTDEAKPKLLAKKLMTSKMKPLARKLRLAELKFLTRKPSRTIRRESCPKAK